MAEEMKDSEGLVVSAWGISDRGRRRERNEDSIQWHDDLHLYIVADGMGGHAGGGQASELAVATISAAVRDHCNDPDITAAAAAGVPLSHDPEEIFRQAIKNASRAIYQQSLDNPKLRGMGTTVVGLWCCDTKAYITNVGDSRGYLIRDGEIIQLTTDHSLVGEQMRAGILSQNDARTHRLKNIITRSVGFQDDVEIDLIARAIRPGDTYLLCSDGLTNMVSDGDILAHVSQHVDLKEACQTLVKIANSNGGDDNITVLLARIDGVRADDDPDATEAWDDPTEHLK